MVTPSFQCGFQKRIHNKFHRRTCPVAERSHSDRIKDENGMGRSTEVGNSSCYPVAFSPQNKLSRKNKRSRNPAITNSTSRLKSALQRPCSNASQISRSSSRRPTSSVSAFSKRQRPSTEDLLRRPQSLVARRPQSELSRFPKEFRYIDKQCFFHPATEPSRSSVFIISPDWVSERKNHFIRKNTLFG